MCLFYRVLKEEAPIQCLLVASIMGVCSGLGTSREWFTALWQAILNPGPPIISTESASIEEAKCPKYSLKPFPPELLRNLLALLEKEDVKAEYARLFPSRNQVPSSEACIRREYVLTIRLEGKLGNTRHNVANWYHFNR